MDKYKNSWVKVLLSKRQKEIAMYHLYESGIRLTTKPMSLDEIKAKFGSILKIERAGFRLVKAS